METDIKEMKQLLYEIKILLTRYVSDEKIVTSNQESVKVYVDMKSLRFISDRKTQQLTYNEAAILDALLNSEQDFCSYEYLCNLIYGTEDVYTQRAIATSMSRIRKKVNGVLLIKTIRNKGFYVKYLIND